MLSWLERIVSACWRPVGRYARMNKDNDDGSCGGGNDQLVWYRDLDKHSCGEFSFAVVQANVVIEDHSQVETGRDGTFIGVYDGHGGPEASRFVSEHLFRHLNKLAKENGSITEEILSAAFSATEDGFLTLVRRSLGLKPLIAAIGSCCLVGVIWNGTLYIANVGDSRAVIGCLSKSNKIVAEQLTSDHNACMEEVRDELRSSHPDDSHIVVMKNGAWRIKGIIQVSRSIGDAYLKQPEFSIDSSFPRFHLAEPIRRPVLSAEPSLSSRPLQPNDKFVIFASDGLWEHMTNQEAVEIVYKYPRTGIARRLLTTALKEAGRKREMRYDELKKMEKGVRRHYHDDITVIVIFVDREMKTATRDNNMCVPELSIRGFIDTVAPSNFNFTQTT
ncbi:probable protein phosphatase 2C 25 [Impatiens glandulifera]|uniref:probable protein phosphatase 2C 25 n=1 Tax=Impatiens glandulifera TaxID=253017 RepID=UPI001FB04B0F|nr:probable protein phosphatase 2C 25 [Impatiens glandulifera]XP_047317668.1 probable protein phosphatase 2C 25 [Impatiens glandulifera]XP_047317669.1 probable protein phosphatase 2C 25 [Impatiens glandulifera]